jgi:dinuclear metal center YbgI/SA1388 family protein
VKLDAIVRYLDDYLRVAEVRDSSEAMNGLQVANAGEVSSVAATVDACEATIRQAAAAGANLLLVHHGLFWGGLRPLTGPTLRRTAGLTDHNIALYSSHLPLDCHPAVGNNPVLARQLGIVTRGGFGEYEGRMIGVWGELDIDRAALVERINKLLGVNARLLPFGPSRAARIGVVTGAGGSAIREAAAAGLDTFISGEGAHWTYFDAEELGVNVIYAGHYATETVGVKALAEHLREQFDLPWVFLDHPTGL